MGTSRTPSLAVDPAGAPLVSWSDNTSGHYEIFARRWNGQSWLPAGANGVSNGGISHNAGNAHAPDLAVTANGLAYVSWYLKEGGDTEVFIRRLVGDEWQEVGANSAAAGGVSDNAGASSNPTLVLAADGVPFLAWADDTSGNYEIYARYWTSNPAIPTSTPTNSPTTAATAEPTATALPSPTQPSTPTRARALALIPVVIHEVLNPGSTATPTATGTPTASSWPLSGWLLLADGTGILQKNLVDGRVEHLLRPGADWIEWGARASTDRTQVAYWVQYDDGGEIWLTSLDKWQPERVLRVEERIELDTVWALGDRYLLGREFFFEEAGLMDELKIARTYVIDVETGELVTGDYWPGGCTTLAPSPRTGQVALWCSPLDMGDAATYLVLEPEAEPWLSEQAPDAMLDNCLLQPVCAWSPDGNYVAYVVDESSPDQLYYTPVNDFSPVHLADEGTDFIGWLRWSPNEQLLHYSGIGDYSGDRWPCFVVLSVQDGRFVWRAYDNLVANSGRELGGVGYGFWLSDRHMAFYGIDSVFYDGRVLIMDIVLGQEVGYLDIGEGYVWDMVLVEQPVSK